MQCVAETKCAETWSIFLSRIDRKTSIVRREGKQSPFMPFNYIRAHRCVGLLNFRRTSSENRRKHNCTATNNIGATKKKKQQQPRAKRNAKSGPNQRFIVLCEPRLPLLPYIVKYYYYYNYLIIL